MSLKEEFELVCNKYVDALCKMWGFNRKEAHWIGDRVGGVIDVNNYAISFDNVRYIVDNVAVLSDYLDWDEYVIMVMDVNKSLVDKITVPNFDHWRKGCPIINIDDIKNLKKNCIMRKPRRYESKA